MYINTIPENKLVWKFPETETKKIWRSIELIKYVDVFTFSVSPTFSENINLSSWLCYKIVFIYIFHLKSILFFNQTHGNLR